MRGVFAAVAAVALAGCMHTGKPSGPSPDQAVTRPPAESEADAQAIATFQARLKEYVALHEKLEKTLPPLPKETNPQILDQHQRAMEKLLREHRKTATRGDVFTPEGERVIRRILARAFAGSDGATFKATIRDESPVDVKLVVNSRYPDEVPLSTMPPQVLGVLPKLPDHVEFRFIGPRLILLDVHAHTVVDYIDNVLPK